MWWCKWDIEWCLSLQHVLDSGDMACATWRFPLWTFEIHDIFDCHHSKGPKGKSPCRTCHITRVQDMLQTQTPFYVPLTPPHDQCVGLISYDPHNLPLHSNNTYRTQLMNIQNAHSTGSQTQCKKNYGINRECILTELPSISISRSFPHDWMHLCLENHRKNLISF